MYAFFCDEAEMRAVSAAALFGRPSAAFHLHQKQDRGLSRQGRILLDVYEQVARCSGMWKRIRGCCDPGKVQPGGVQEGATEVPHLGGQAPTLSKKRRRALHLFLLREAQCVHGPRRSGRELGLIDPRLSSTDDCRRLLAGKTQHREA
ncbi:hypothetical protein MRX96_016194 [Rhipicephalus microplus]